MEVDEPSNILVETQPNIIKLIPDQCKEYVQQIFKDEISIVKEGLKQIRDFIIGNELQKRNYILIVPRLVFLMKQPTTGIETKTLCAVILSSLAFGSEENIEILLDKNVLETIKYQLNEQNQFFYKVCLKCIKSIAMSRNSKAKKAVVEKLPEMLETIFHHMNWSSSIKECSCDIITACCQTRKDQEMFIQHGVIDVLFPLVLSNYKRVKLCAVKALSALTYKNKKMCEKINLYSLSNGEKMVDRLGMLLKRTEDYDLQIYAASTLAYLFQCYGFEIQASDPQLLISVKVGPCLVRLCDKNRTTEQRVKAATSLAILIEKYPHLQRLLYWCEALPLKLEAFFTSSASSSHNHFSNKKKAEQLEERENLATAAFSALSALVSNEESIRKKIATDVLIKRLTDHIENSESYKVRASAICCLLSFSRSVYVSRTNLKNQEVWKTVLKAATRRDIHETEVASLCALISNLLLSFSPSRKPLLGGGIVKHVLTWLKNTSNKNVVRNIMHMFSNLTFKAAGPSTGAAESVYEMDMEVLEVLKDESLCFITRSDDCVITTHVLNIYSNVLCNFGYADDIMEKHANLIGDLVVRSLTSSFCSNLTNLPSQKGEEQVVIAALRLFKNMVGCRPSNFDVRTFCSRNWNTAIRNIVNMCNFYTPDDNIMSESLSCLCSLILTLNTNPSDSISDYVTLYQALQMAKNCEKLTKYCKLMAKVDEATDILQQMQSTNPM